MTTRNLEATFVERLHYCQQFKPTYRGALANHVPMAIIAMNAIGADVDLIDRFIDQNRSILEQVKPVPFEIHHDNWLQHLGQRDAFCAYRTYFQTLVERDGWRNVVTGHIGSLMGGISASAFHCLIRLGLGIRQNSAEEVVIALAYFASEYQSLGEVLRSEETGMTLATVLDRLADDGCLCNRTFEAPNIIRRLNKVAAVPGFQRVAALLDGCTIGRAELADFALRLFAGSGSFTALHGVTSCHALRWLLPLVNNEQRCLQFYARALLCAYVSIGTPKVVQWEALNLSACKPDTWQQIFVQALSSMNEHKIKMVFSCYDEWLLFRHAGYPYCAALVLECDV